MLDGSVEHVWVSEADDSFEQLEAAFGAYRDQHPAPEGAPPPTRSANTWTDRLGAGQRPAVALLVLAVMTVGLGLFLLADPFVLRVLGQALVVVPGVVALLRGRARRS